MASPSRSSRPYHTELYRIWQGMIRRCEDPSRKDYHKYGARGLTVSDGWHDFDTFYDWAISAGFRPGFQLDRFNNNKGYSENNCRWVTRRQNCSNRSTNRHIALTIDGTMKVRTLEQWCAITGVTPDRVLHRVEHGWTIEDAILTPVRKRGKAERRGGSQAQERERDDALQARRSSG